ncbi:hypothetical protein [Actinomycetospora callitridis]|uniref:hypothetical protein n=1 Tax=Actinomycetospora callitridis TaxID=913944 RepID=UPI002365CA1D|nr:hypothetical protein [Actinomycetospora callitridis]MDD7919816.1 hypothetical protein [Actinomycetospora callitridis]
MRVLESPITWIVVAAVLLVVAIVLIAVSSVRRRRARRAAATAAWPPPTLESGRPDPGAAWSDPATARRRPSSDSRTAGSPVSNLDDASDATVPATYSDPPTDPLDVDAVRAGLAEPTTEEAPPEEPHRPRHAASADGEAGPETGQETGPDTESAKDRLLAVLLGDPEAAVAALAAADSDGGTTASDGDVTALLRAGLSPSQVARLVGVDESRLAALVARRLGLLPDDQPPSGTNRTDEPGRSWANAGSSAGSTTPTTG